MSRPIGVARNVKDPLFVGIRALQRWAEKEKTRRFAIEWSGIARLDGKGRETYGGFYVRVWTAPRHRGNTVGASAPLLDEAAAKAMEEFEAREAKKL